MLETDAGESIYMTYTGRLKISFELAVDRFDQVAEKPPHAFLDALTLPTPLEMDSRCT
jgi:hypothetical protein